VATETRQRLYLIDGYSNIFRAYFAIPSLSNSKGIPTNATYGFLNMLRKLLREEAPDLIGVALDVAEKTVRSERFADYKATRRPMPEDLAPQIPWIRRAIEAHRIPILEVDRYEADDVLGTLAKRAAAAGYDVVLVSADKDLTQLVGPHVSLFHTGREKLYGPREVEEDFGVPPEKVADVLALKGDSVDNIPGVPGIGEKGARELIREHGSLEALLEHRGEVSRKSYREGLERHREQALLSKELVTIHTDLDLGFDPEALRREAPDPEALRQIFAELEFFSLLAELEASAAQEELAGVRATGIATAEEWRRRAGELPAEIHLALIEGLGLAAGGAEDGILYADFRRPGLADAALASLRAWAGEPGRRLVGHDLKEVLRRLPEGRLARSRLGDTMLGSYLLSPAVHGHSLDEVALERLRHRTISPKEAGWSKGAEPPLDSDSLLAFAGERVELTRRLAPRMFEELATAGLLPIYEELEEPLLTVLLGMEERGVLLDAEYLTAMSGELAGELAGLEREIYELAGEEFNINSSQQLRVILFDKLGYPVLKRTKKTKSYSTGAETLEELAVRGYPLPQRLLRYRELAKLKSTYVDALPALVAADGRLHTRFNQAVAATGRLSSANPNLQNIPVRTELGQRIRRAFIAGPGMRLVVADYSQIELRILAHIAGEPALAAAFAAGDDIHAATAATVFGLPREKVSPNERRAAKVINFGILYGMSAYGLGQTLGIPPADADRFIKAYLERYPEVRRYMDETLAAAEKEGKVETLYGRVRWLPDIHSRNWNLRENARRMAINARIQGTAADLLKKAMIAVARRLSAEHPAAGLLLTVHDELVLEAPAADAAAVGELVKAEMEGVERLAVPLVVEVGAGDSWYEAKA
jgi:DNA polymerase-1